MLQEHEQEKKLEQKALEDNMKANTSSGPISSDHSYRLQNRLVTTSDESSHGGSRASSTRNDASSRDGGASLRPHASRTHRRGKFQPVDRSADELSVVSSPQRRTHQLPPTRKSGRYRQKSSMLTGFDTGSDKKEQGNLKNPPEDINE